MRWEDEEKSGNVEDRRGMPVSRGMVGGGIGTVILVLVALYFGIDPSVILQTVPDSGPPAATQQQQRPAGKDPMVDFVSVVLADTEKTWHGVFRTYGRTYEEPKLVLFNGAVQSACGFAQAAMGPFYCPEDHKVYLDLSFFEDLKNRFNAPGDFAEAYVIAHEVGHHVQNQLGITEKVQSTMQRVSRTDANRLSVRMELQADCLAGVWGHAASQSGRFKAGQVELEPGDAEQALRAAAAIGDDRLQKMTTGHVMPDRFTHGTSAQRVDSFRHGMDSGDLRACGAAALGTQ